MLWRLYYDRDISYDLIGFIPVNVLTKAEQA